MADPKEMRMDPMFFLTKKIIEESTETLIRQYRGEAREVMIESYKSQMLYNCKLQNDWIVQQYLLSEVPRRYEENDVKRINEIYEALPNTHSDEDPHEHEWYVEFLKKVEEWRAKVDAESDQVAQQKSPDTNESNPGSS